MRKPVVLCLSFIVLLGLSLRLAYLLHVTLDPGFTWVDPDHYMRKVLDLARGEDGWHWSFDAVRHSVEGRHYTLPPLYPFFLSLFALFPHYPLTAQIGQALLATLSILLLFDLGRQLHSERAGLIASGIYAVWLPSIIAVWSTMQEALYVPLVLLAFVLLVRALQTGRSMLWLGAGAFFGLAALTRSMPVYFVPTLVVLILVLRGEPRRTTASVLTLVAGFALFTIPYSVALSLHLGEPTLIENHGGLRVVTRYGGNVGDTPPGLVETAVAIVRAFVANPATLSSDWRSTARSLFYVNGGRLLQIYLGAETRFGATLWKLAAHTFADLLFIATLLLAPLGVVLAKRRPVALIFALWILLNIVLTALSGFGGPRLRAPIEPHLVVAAAVVLAGGYRRPHWAWLAVAALTSVSVAALVLPQVPASLHAKGDYRVHWPLDRPPKRSPMLGEAGFNVLAVDGTVELAVRPRNLAGATKVVVSLEGEPAEEVTAMETEHRLRYEWPRLELVHVELTAADAGQASP